jgi:hypothetical protein
LLRFPFATPANESAAQQPPANDVAAAGNDAANGNVDRGERTGFLDWLMSLMGADHERTPPPVHVVNQLQDMFPHVPREALVEDLVWCCITCIAMVAALCPSSLCHPL